MHLPLSCRTLWGYQYLMVTLPLVQRQMRYFTCPFLSVFFSYWFYITTEGNLLCGLGVHIPQGLPHASIVIQVSEHRPSFWQRSGRCCAVRVLSLLARPVIVHLARCKFHRECQNSGDGLSCWPLHSNLLQNDTLFAEHEVTEPMLKISFCCHWMLYKGVYRFLDYYL